METDNPSQGRRRLVILGAGCAGLALARRLEFHGFEGEVILLEERSSTALEACGQRWCFWGPPPDPVLAGAVSANWLHWQVRHGAEVARQADPAWSYRQIRARDYRAVLRARLEARGWRQHDGVRVLAVEQLFAGWLVRTEAGTWFADEVIDARGPAEADKFRSPDGFAPARQTFVGWEIETRGACFAPGVATLMEFQPAPHGQVHFVYVLPYTERRALVEYTEIAPPDRVSSEAELLRHLERWLGARWSHFDVHEREAGSLPLGEIPSQPRTVGATAGALRPSSGYGFLTSWEQADQRARELCGLRGGSAERGSLVRWLDAVLLRVLTRQPEILPAAFFGLFRRLPSPALARFLNGRPRASDLLRAVAAMPVDPFLRAAFGLRPAAVAKPEVATAAA